MERWEREKKVKQRRCPVCRKPCVRKFCGRSCFKKYWKTVVAPRLASRSRNRVTLRCQFCKKLYWAHFWRRRKSRYCSIACKDAANLTPREKRICLNCRKPFQARVDRKTKFCSRVCHYRMGLGWRGGQVRLRCPVCKKMFEVVRNKYQRRKREGKEIRCSQPCFTATQLWKKSPNYAERALEKILRPLGFQYVGNGRYQVGAKYPDFVHSRKKVLVELFGGKWHKRAEEKQRILYMKKHGFLCLVVWYKDLQEPEEIERKVSNLLKQAA